MGGHRECMGGMGGHDTGMGWHGRACGEALEKDKGCMGWHKEVHGSAGGDKKGAWWEHGKAERVHGWA